MTTTIGPSRILNPETVINLQNTKYGTDFVYATGSMQASVGRKAAEKILYIKSSIYTSEEDRKFKQIIDDCVQRDVIIT